MLRWCESTNIPPQKQFINSPYDPEARFQKKRSTMWTGYTIYLTEVCDDGSPHLITHVATTLASTTDDAMTETIHQHLQANDLLPAELIGPGKVNVQWQASTPQGIDNSQFQMNWDISELSTQKDTQVVAGYQRRMLDNAR